MITRQIFFVLAAMALSTACARAQIIKPLLPPSGTATTFAQSIDNNNQAVGWSPISGTDTATLWRPTGGTYTAQALPVPANNAHSVANSIALTGNTIAGYAQPADQSTATATLWNQTSPNVYSATALPSTAGAVLSSAYSISTSGHVAGFATDAGDVTRAVLWNPAHTPVVLPNVGPNQVQSSATAVNSFGEVVGYYVLTQNMIDKVYASVWTPNGAGYTTHTVIAAGDDTLISAMNDYGTGAGVTNGDQAAVMAYFEGDYYAAELDVPFGSSDSAANAVNSFDGLCGYLKDPTTGQAGSEAALWLPTETSWQLINLDQFLNQRSPSLGSQWILTDATGINDNWLVTGNGLFNGVERGFVLDISSLVPEPATMSMVFLPLVLMVRRRTHSASAQTRGRSSGSSKSST